MFPRMLRSDQKEITIHCHFDMESVRDRDMKEFHESTFDGDGKAQLVEGAFFEFDIFRFEFNAPAME